MHEAVHKGYMNKDARQRGKREVAEVWADVDGFCRSVTDDLQSDTYIVGDYRHFRLHDKKKERDISVLPFRDRCVQNADKQAIEPLILRQLTDDMVGGLPERGVLSNTAHYSVVRRMQRIMADLSLTHYIQGDISKFYDSVDNVIAMRLIERCVTDRRTLALTRQHLFKQKRLAIGDPFSHLIANLVMSTVIRAIKTECPTVEIVNFADDIFIAGHSKEELEKAREVMKRAAKEVRLHYKTLYIRPMPGSVGSGSPAAVTFCGLKFTRHAVLLSQRTKKRYVRARHKRRSMGAYNGILGKCDSKHLRQLVERNDNRHMADKIRRPFAGAHTTIERMEGVKHTIVNKAEKKSKKEHSDTYMHVQAIADKLGLVVYCTSSPKICQYLRENTVPMRDMVITKDWSGYFYEGTVYTDEEEEKMLREQFNIPNT